MSDRFGPSVTCEECLQAFNFGELEDVFVEDDTFEYPVDGEIKKLCKRCKKELQGESI